VTRIRWTTEAADRLEAIVNQIREDNPEAARAVAQAILDRIAGLKKFAGLGRPGEWKGTRELVSPPYVVVYRLKETSPKFFTFGMVRRTGANRGQPLAKASSLPTKGPTKVIKHPKPIGSRAMSGLEKRGTEDVR
jgi:plasmid stabilization system protein ParE